MFRPVRKKANEISVEEAKKLLHEARRGVLAVSGDDGYPYAVPINYLYDEDAQETIFHGSKVGHKVDGIKCHQSPVYLMRNRQIEVSLRYFHCQVLRTQGEDTTHQGTRKHPYTFVIHFSINYAPAFRCFHRSSPFSDYRWCPCRRR